jgi:hypothetical protein
MFAKNTSNAGFEMCTLFFGARAIFNIGIALLLLTLYDSICEIFRNILF